MPHFDSTEPKPPEPFLLDVADPEVAYPRFKRRMTLMERIDALEARLATLEARLDQKPQKFRVVNDWRGSSLNEPECISDYPARDGKGDEQC